MLSLMEGQVKSQAAVLKTTATMVHYRLDTDQETDQSGQMQLTAL